MLHDYSIQDKNDSHHITPRWLVYVGGEVSIQLGNYPAQAFENAYCREPVGSEMNYAAGTSFWPEEEYNVVANLADFSSVRAFYYQVNMWNDIQNILEYIQTSDEIILHDDIESLHNETIIDHALKAGWIEQTLEYLKYRRTDKTPNLPADYNEKISDDACPGCLCEPGDGKTEGCNDKYGCGFSSP